MDSGQVESTGLPRTSLASPDQGFLNVRAWRQQSQGNAAQTAPAEQPKT